MSCSCDQHPFACRCSSGVEGATESAQVRGLLLPGTARAPQPSASAPTLPADGRQDRDPRLPHLPARGITPQDAGLNVFGQRGCRDCAARRSRRSPGSASTTTTGWSAATSAAPPTASWTRWPSAAARRGRTRAPVRPRPRRQPARSRPAPLGHPHVRPQRAVDARLDDRPGGLRRERPPRRARRQPARARTLPRPLRSGAAARPTGRASSSSTPGRGFYADWDRAAKDCVAILRTEAGRTRTTESYRPRRRARHAERGVPRPLGRPQRPAAHQGRQALQPPGRGRAGAQLQPAGA